MEIQRSFRPLRGLESFVNQFPGVSLAKPRYTPGYMLKPAPRAMQVQSKAGEQMKAYAKDGDDIAGHQTGFEGFV